MTDSIFSPSRMLRYGRLRPKGTNCFGGGPSLRGPELVTFISQGFTIFCRRQSKGPKRVLWLGVIGISLHQRVVLTLSLMFDPGSNTHSRAWLPHWGCFEQYRGLRTGITKIQDCWYHLSSRIGLSRPHLSPSKSNEHGRAIHWRYPKACLSIVARNRHCMLPPAVRGEQWQDYSLSEPEHTRPSVP